MKIFLLILVLTVMEPGGYAQEPLLSGTTQLSMMDQSIDDMFDGCITEMETQVQKVFFPQEIQKSPFRDGWNAPRCSKHTMLKTIMQSSFKGLTNNHTRALCVYTAERPNVYNRLNEVLKTSAANYNSDSFEFHALYFWLTSAIQLLPKSCETTYRRSKNVYSGQINQRMRFGQFASSSRKTDQYYFGTETCFHIKTCLGAYIEPYSVIKGEEEVLIPPYEVFKVKNIVPNSYGSLKNCNKIFVLENVEHKSTLNCKAANHSQQISANLKLILGVQIWIVLLWNNSLKQSD